MKYLLLLFLVGCISKPTETTTGKRHEVPVQTTADCHHYPDDWVLVAVYEEISVTDGDTLWRELEYYDLKPDSVCFWYAPNARKMIFLEL